MVGKAYVRESLFLPVATPQREPAHQASRNELPLLRIAKTTFLAWEKLRLLYVLILAAFTLIVVDPLGIFDPRYTFAILGGAFVANLAYFAGPLLETYIRWLGYDRSWPRWFFFIGGTLLSMMLAWAVLISI